MGYISIGEREAHYKINIENEFYRLFNEMESRSNGYNAIEIYDIINQNFHLFPLKGLCTSFHELLLAILQEEDEKDGYEEDQPLIITIDRYLTLADLFLNAFFFYNQLMGGSSPIHFTEEHYLGEKDRVLKIIDIFGYQAQEISKKPFKYFRISKKDTLAERVASSFNDDIKWRILSFNTRGISKDEQLDILRALWLPFESIRDHGEVSSIIGICMNCGGIRHESKEKLLPDVKNFIDTYPDALKMIFDLFLQAFIQNDNKNTIKAIKDAVKIS